MKKRFLTGRGLLAGAVLAAGGGALAYWAVPASAAGTPPQISVVTGHAGAGTVTLGHPKPEATAHISAGNVAYDPANGDEAVAVITGTGQAHVYLIAGATEANEYNIETTATGPTYGSLVKGDVYLMAGSGSLGMISDPGASTTLTGGSASPAATGNPISPISLTFDNSGNLVVAESHSNTSQTASGIQVVAKSACSTSCPYGYSTLTAGDLYTVAGVGAWRGVTRTPAITFEFQVKGWGVAVDSSGNIIDSANGAVLFLNEQSASVSRYGKTLASKRATVIAGTATGTGAGTCGSGNKNVPATGASSANLQFPHPIVDASGNVYVNDNRGAADTGCTWVLPAANGSLDGQTMTAGDLYSLTGAATTTAATNGAVANTSGLPNPSGVALDPAGNLVVSLAGATPSLAVIAESNGAYYDQSMTKGHVYIISGGATASRTTTPGNATGFKFSGTAAVATEATPPFGITSLVKGAPGDLLLTDGTSATTGTLYLVTKGPTAASGPTATSTSLRVSPTSPAYHGTTVTMTATVTPSGAVGTVEFLNGTTVLATKPVVSGVATFSSSALTAGTYSLTAKFVPTTATVYETSTSTPAISYTVSAETNPAGRNPTGVVQPIAETIKAGALTLSCTHAVTAEATAIKTCPLITLPQVTLSGVQQTESKTMNTVYVYTARGTATSGWALSAVMTPTVHTLNTNASCDTVQGFCNSTDGTHAATAPHGQIPATDLALAGYACTPASTNHNPTPTPSSGGTLKTPLALCTAAAGSSGGVFGVGNGTFTLTIPSTVFHGLYYGTVEYTLVSTS